MKNIKPVVSRSLEINSHYSMEIFALSQYRDPVKAIVYAKYSNQRQRFSQLADLMWQRMELHNLEFDYLIPVPLHWTRLAYRGFNQSQVIAQRLAQLSSKKVISPVQRSSYTFFQSTFSGSARAKNVKGAFSLAKHQPNLEGKTLVLVDDVITTGSTLREMALQLAKLKPKRIIALVACRGG